MNRTDRPSILPSLTVVVNDDHRLKDATLVDRDGEGSTLVMRKTQSFDNAVERLMEMFPDETADDIRRLLRQHMPQATFDTLLVQAGPTPSYLRREDDEASGRRPGRLTGRRVTVLLCALVVAVFALVMVVVYSLMRGQTLSLFERKEFQAFAQEASMECRPTEVGRAECINRDQGTVWQVTATRGESGEPDAYRFSHDDQLATVYIFDTTRDREKYPQNRAYQRLWPFLTARDRVMIGATDSPVLKDMAGAVDDSVLENIPTSAAPVATVRPTGIPSHEPMVRPRDELPAGPKPTSVVPWPSDATPSPTPSRAEATSPAADTGTPDAETGTPLPARPAAGDAPTSPPATSTTSDDSGISVELPRVTVTVNLPL